MRHELHAQIEIDAPIEGGNAIMFRPRITVVEPPVAFEWLGRLGLPGLFDGRHRFDLAETRNPGEALEVHRICGGQDGAALHT